MNQSAWINFVWDQNGDTWNESTMLWDQQLPWLSMSDDSRVDVNITFTLLENRATFNLTDDQAAFTLLESNI